MKRRRPLVTLLAVTTALTLSACSSLSGTASKEGAGASSGSGSSAGAPANQAPTSLGRPVPLVSSLTTTGKSTMKPAVVHVDLTNISQITLDGTTFTMTSAQAAGLKAGSLFVVDGIASRKVTGVTPSGDSVQVATVQATPDEIFQDLDVSFDGVPDMTNAIVDGSPVTGPGEDQPFSSGPVTDSGPTAASSAGTPSSVSPPTKLRGGQPAIRAAGCKARTGSLKFTIDPITITPSITTNATCTGFNFSAEVSSDKGPVNASVTFTGGVNILRMNGHMTAGASGSSQTGGVKISGAINAGGNARAEEAGGFTQRYKATWDLLKIDYPIIIEGVPFVMRVGIPLIFEPRFSGKHDTAQGQYLTVSCNGTVNLGSAASSTDVNVCSMKAASIAAFTNIAPSAIVFAAGLKVGFGPGLVVKEKAVVFAGGTVTLAASVGISSSGATSTGLLDCIRVDRSVQINVGVEGTLGGTTLSASRTIKQKQATDSIGSRCPKT